MKNTLVPSSTSIARMRYAAKLCRSGAWIIAAVGLIVVIYLVFFVIVNVNNGGPDGSSPDSRQLLMACAIALLMIIPIFFFSVFLYAVSALLDYLNPAQSPDKPRPDIIEEADDDERIVITPLPK